MSEPDEGLDWREHTDKWTRDVNGYAICPRCGAMVHQQMIHFHADACGRIDPVPTDRGGEA